MSKHVAATQKDVASCNKMLFHALFSFPVSAAGKVVSTLSISSGSGTTPLTARGSSQHPTGESVPGNSHFNFSMLVFSADFPTDTKSRWKRPKTAETGKQRHKDVKCALCLCWNTMQPVNCIPVSCVLLLEILVFYFVPCLAIRFPDFAPHD